jgi:hypothetical protein
LLDAAAHSNVRPFVAELAAAPGPESLVQHADTSEQLRAKASRNSLDDGSSALEHECIDAATHVAAAVSDSHHSGAAVFPGAPHPLDEAMGFEFFHNAGHRTGGDAALGRELGKPRALFVDQSAQNAALPWGQILTADFVGTNPVQHSGQALQFGRPGGKLGPLGHGTI